MILSDDADCALGADEESFQVVAGVLIGFAAELRNGTVCEDNFESGDMVYGDAIRECVRSAGIFSDVAANSAGLLARGIGCEVESMLHDGLREFQIHHARLHGGAAIGDIYLEDLPHTREDHDDATLARNGAAAQTGARATRNNGDAGLSGQTNDRRNLLGSFGKNDDFRSALGEASVVLVQHQVFRPVEYSVCSESRTKLRRQCGNIHASRKRCLGG